jgi:hypothetical protein
MVSLHFSIPVTFSGMSLGRVVVEVDAEVEVDEVEEVEVVDDDVVDAGGMVVVGRVDDAGAAAAEDRPKDCV